MVLLRGVPVQVLLQLLLPILLPHKAEVWIILFSLCWLPVCQRLNPGVMLGPVGVHCRLGWPPVGVLEGNSRPASTMKHPVA